jgi:hypothetical protein
MQSEIKKYKRNYFFIKKKYHFYLSALSDLLNKIHNIKINKKIWTFLFSLIFMRIVLILNDIYNDFKKNEYNLGNRPGLT